MAVSRPRRQYSIKLWLWRWPEGYGYSMANRSVTGGGENYISENQYGLASNKAETAGSRLISGGNGEIAAY
jgi:hypothetical protein